MKQIEIIDYNGRERMFRTNNSGDYLFIGQAENVQISCESGFQSLSRMKKAIREYMKQEWDREYGYDGTKMPRIKYYPSNWTEWVK